MQFRRFHGKKQPLVWWLFRVHYQTETPEIRKPTDPVRRDIQGQEGWDRLLWRIYGLYKSVEHIWETEHD